MSLALRDARDTQKGENGCTGSSRDRGRVCTRSHNMEQTRGNTHCGDQTSGVAAGDDDTRSRGEDLSFRRSQSLHAIAGETCLLGQGVVHQGHETQAPRLGCDDVWHGAHREAVDQHQAAGWDLLEHGFRVGKGSPARERKTGVEFMNAYSPAESAHALSKAAVVYVATGWGVGIARYEEIEPFHARSL